MAVLSRMRFTSDHFPAGDGALVLADDGRFHVEVSEAMLEHIAARETEIVEQAWRAAVIAAVGFAALGAASLAAGWLAGRIGGRLRERWTDWRPASEAAAEYNPGAGLRLHFSVGALQPVTLEWNPEEYTDPAEAEHFFAEFQKRRAGGGS